MSKHIINYTQQGKILGFAKGDTDLNIEVSNAIWVEAQNYNKIIIDGDKISFNKADWRTEEEIAKQELQSKINEAKAYLASTDYKMTVDYFATLTEAEQVQLAQLRAEARTFIRANEVI